MCLKLKSLTVSDMPSLDKNAPATDSEVEALEKHLGIKLPETYYQFLKSSNGLYDPDSGCLIYATHELAERNQTYSVLEDAPGYVLIGADGGGRGILIENKTGEIFMTGLAHMVPDDFTLVANNIHTFLQHRIKHVHEIDTSLEYAPNEAVSKDIWGRKK